MNFSEFYRTCVWATGAVAEWSSVGSVSTDTDGVLNLSSFECFENPVYVGKPNMAAVGKSLMNKAAESVEVGPVVPVVRLVQVV